MPVANRHTSSSSRKSPVPAPGAIAGKTKPLAKAKPANKSAPAPRARPGTRKKGGASPEQRSYYIEIAAYYIAERRGFASGDPLQDWVEAEAEIDRLLAEGYLGN